MALIQVSEILWFSQIKYPLWYLMVLQWILMVILMVMYGYFPWDVMGFTLW